jgi:hypothetical protein
VALEVFFFFFFFFIARRVSRKEREKKKKKERKKHHGRVIYCVDALYLIIYKKWKRKWTKRLEKNGKTRRATNFFGVFLGFFDQKKKVS